ncbi:MAG TPA: AbrB/MazE/SpoVT family DNA-binding domain-containing protein [Methylococcaceae bacterium]|nr:AbrB/MazE/SpoVT family DNA-binding domain-containing protein [Methylococcaceae bacterium]
MSIVTVSDKGQVVIPADIRRRLGIAPGCQLDFTLEGNGIRVELKRPIRPTRPDEGFGMLVCKKPGERCLSDFDVAAAMREAADDRA